LKCRPVILQDGIFIVCHFVFRAEGHHAMSFDKPKNDGFTIKRSSRLVLESLMKLFKAP